MTGDEPTAEEALAEGLRLDAIERGVRRQLRRHLRWLAHNLDGLSPEHREQVETELLRQKYVYGWSPTDPEDDQRS